MKSKCLIFLFISFLLSCGSTDPNSFLKRGDYCLQKGDFNRAIKAYTYVISIDSLNYEAYYCRSIAYQSKGENNLALADLAKAILIHPNYDAFIQRGQILQKQNKFLLSINDFSKAIEFKKSEESYALRSYSFIMLKEYEKALFDLDSAIIFSPKNSKLLFDRAALKIALDKNREAISDVNAGMVFDKKSSTAYINRGLAYKNIGKKDSAIVDFKKAVDFGDNYGQELLKKFYGIDYK